MRNPNGPSIEEKEEWSDELADQERKRLSGVLSAASFTCTHLAVRIDIRASRATEGQHQNGTWGDWRHDAEIMRMAVRVLEREIKIL